MLSLRLITVLTALACGVFSANALAEVPECVPRDGLPNVRARLDSGQPLRVAFLGGSITAANGWRVLVRDHLKAVWPRSAQTELFAAIPGTDSAFGACRVGNDVLARHPDLLFVEFAVNDSGADPDRIREAMEGIVRQTWQAGSATDICFVYTLNQTQLADYRAGRHSATARAMETVADHYGIPSVAFGPEIARRVEAGTLLFKGPSAGLDADGRNADGLLVFTADGTHPLAAGHRVYFSVLERALPALFAGGRPGPRALPPALTTAPWSDAGIRPVATLDRTGDWTPLPDRDKRTAWQPAAITPPVWLAATAGSAAAFEVDGTGFGLVGLKGPDCGQFSVTVDGLPPVTTTFFDAYSVEDHYRLATWFYPRPLPSGRHVVRIELLDTVIDKTAILARRGYAPRDPAAFAPLRLYLAGVLLPHQSAPKP